MTPDQVRGWLAALQQECDAATSGPWEAHESEPWVVGAEFADRMAGLCIAEMSDDDDGRTDAAFIASSRSSVSTLIDMVTAVLDLCDEADARDKGNGQLFVGDGCFFTDELRAALAAATGDQQ